jgi:flagellar motor switch protein FliM
MAEILSQQEIDSLLAGMKDEQPTGEAETQDDRYADKDVLVFDFRLPHRLSKNQLRTLQAVHESFGESLSSFLVSRLQTNVSVKVTSVDQIFYSEYVLSIASPSSLYIFRIRESDALAILELSPDLVLGMVARLLGGAPEEEKKTRHITRIEQSIVKGIITRCLEDLQKAWKMISPLTFVHERYESEGEFAQVAPASEIVLVVSFEVHISERKYLMNICFPTFALDDVLAKLNMQHFSGMSGGSEQNESSETILKSIEDTTIPVTGVLGTTRLTLQELISLEPGDVVRTNIPVNGEVELLIGGKSRLWGRPGIVNSKPAIKITRTEDPSDKKEE